MSLMVVNVLLFDMGAGISGMDLYSNIPNQPVAEWKQPDFVGVLPSKLE